MTISRTSRKAMTLIEVLAVTAILALLTGLSFGAIQRAREAANRARCQHNLRQIGLALHNYHGTHDSFPPGIRTPPAKLAFVSWRVRLLPFLEQDRLWADVQQFVGLHPLFWVPPRPPSESMNLSVFVCPSEIRVSAVVQPEGVPIAFSHYLGVSGTASAGAGGLLFMNSRVRLADVTDGTSTTLLVGERPPSPDNRFGWWYAGIGQMGDGSADSHLGVRETVQSVRAPMCAGLAPPYGPGIADNMCDAFHFWSRHPGGSEFLFVDGAVHFISYSAKDLLPALATRAGGEPAELP